MCSLLSSGGRGVNKWGHLCLSDKSGLFVQNVRFCATTELLVFPNKMPPICHQVTSNLPPRWHQVATKLPPSYYQVTTMFQPKSPPTTNWRDKMSLHRCSIDRSHLLCVRNSRESRPLPLIMMIMLVTVMAVVVMMTREGDDNHEGGWWVSKGSSVLPFRLQGISRQESFRQLPQIPTPHTIIKSKCLEIFVTVWDPLQIQTLQEGNWQIFLKMTSLKRYEGLNGHKEKEVGGCLISHNLQLAFGGSLRLSD